MINKTIISLEDMNDVESVGLSGLSSIPDGWEIFTLGDLFDFKNGLNKAKEFFGYGTPIVNYMDVYSSVGIYEQDLKGRVSVDSLEQKNFSAKKGDVFFTRTSETPEEIGLAAVLLEDVASAVYSGFVLRARQKTELLDIDFSKYCFRSEMVRCQIKSTASYTTRALTNGKLLSEVYVALPPKKEQTAIANALSDVDALITELEKLIAKKHAIKTATMQQLLTGRTRLPQFSLREDGSKKGYKQSELGEVPEDWEVKKFSEVTSLITCGIAATPTYVPEGRGYPFLSSTNIKNGRIHWNSFKYIAADLHKQLYKNNPPLKGDVLYSRVGTIGEAAVIEEEFQFSVYVSLTLIKPIRHQLNSYYLAELLNSAPYKERANEEVYLGGGVGNLNVEVVRNYPIPIPAVEEQMKIAAILGDMRDEIQALEKRISKTRQIKQGMMQELLTGKTRLIKPEECEA